MWSHLGRSNGARGGFSKESGCARGNSDLWKNLSYVVDVRISPMRGRFLDNPRYFIFLQGGDLAVSSGCIPKASVGPFMRLKQLQ